MGGRLDRHWWSRGDENGYWVLIIQKADFQIGDDAWGYKKGEMIEEVMSLLPLPPSLVTTEEIAKRLSRGSQRPTREFLKAIQRCLRQLRAKGAARSLPVGPNTQLARYRRLREVEKTNDGNLLVTMASLRLAKIGRNWPVAHWQLLVTASSPTAIQHATQSQPRSACA